MTEIKRTCFISTQLLQYKARLDGLRTEYLEIKKIKKNPEIYINEYFAECIRKIDLQREIIIESQESSQESSETNLYLLKVVDEAKNKLENIESMLSSLEINDEIFDELFLQKKAIKYY